LVTNEAEIDTLLRLLENPVRRRIVRRLSREPSYAFQMAKELGLSQALVTKHLGVMEKAGAVSSTKEESAAGPPRRLYSLAKSVTVTLDLGPNMFMEKAHVFGALGEDATESGESLFRKVVEVLREATGEQSLNALSSVLKEVDENLREAEKQREELLFMRNRVMEEAARLMFKMEDIEKKEVLHHILDQHNRTVASISRALDMRESVVRKILEELESEHVI